MKKLFIFLAALLLSIPAYSQGLFTLTSWELEEIPITGGEGKTAVAGYRIQYSADFVAAVEFIDTTGDTTTVFVRPDDSAVELPLRAYPSCVMIDCPYFRQIGSAIYYRNSSNEMRALVINPNDSYTDDFFTDANQFAINQNGEMVIIYGDDVNYRETNGTLHSLDETYNSSYLDLSYTINAHASNKKFVFEWENGFMVGTTTNTHGDFQKWFMKNGNLNGMPAKQNSYYNWVTDPIHNQFYDTYVDEPGQAPGCFIRDLSSDVALACNTRVYSLGDESTDTVKNEFPTGTANQANFKLATSDNNLYYSSNQPDGSPKGLYVMQFMGPTAIKIEDVNNINTIAAYTDATGDVVIFCGTRYSDGTPVIVQIDNADITPDTTEVESSCNGLVPLH